MKLSEEITASIFNNYDDHEFERLAIEIFRFQARSCKVYREFCFLMAIDPAKVNSIKKIPFLPVSLFRDQKIISGNEEKVRKIFTSSGTTGSIPSKHHITDLKLYEESFVRSFSLFYGNPAGYRFLALLPGYLERQDSSLVYMMDHFISLTKANGSGFFLKDMENLSNRLKENGNISSKTMLFGASYALLDFAEKYPGDYGDMMVMETGGMKGRKKEMVREELHDYLCERLGVQVIHSEYGMTELLSQAYSQGRGIFRTPPWMKVIARDTNDPMAFLPPGRTGGINIIDLANVYSCAFISTQDLGKVYEDGSFEVLGRFDESDIRGCNLLVV